MSNEVTSREHDRDCLVWLGGSVGNPAGPPWGAGGRRIQTVSDGPGKGSKEIERQSKRMIDGSEEEKTRDIGRKYPNARHAKMKLIGCYMG